MKKHLIAMLLVFSGYIYAENSSQHIKANIEMKNVHGVVASGTWFSLELQDNIVASTGTQHFTATLVDPIFNQNMTEGLIPAKAVINGTYRNDGSTCSFEIERISYNNTRTRVLDVGGTDIDLQPGAYTKVNATTPNQLECNPSYNYGSRQHLEFQTKVDIAGLDPIVHYSKDYVVKPSPLNFVQAFGTSSYAITGITKFTNGFMQVKVKFYDKSLRDKLVPVYFDEFGLAHCLNYTLISTDEQLSVVNDTNSYLILSHYNNFGLGIVE